VLFLELESGLRQPFQQQFKGGKRRSDGRRAKTVEDTTKNACRGSFMDVGIIAVQVAQARLETKGFLFKDKEVVGPQLGEGVCNSELEGHVEARYSKVAREDHSAKVVNGGPATRNEPEDALQAVATSTRDLQNTTRFEAQTCKPSDQGQEQRIVFGVKRNVEKDTPDVCQPHRLSGKHCKRGLRNLLVPSFGRSPIGCGSACRGWIALRAPRSSRRIIALVITKLFQDPVDDLHVLASDTQGPLDLVERGGSDDVLLHIGNLTTIPSP
jgi:hypothetical protein